jgi:small subunit ribosomal protein S7
MPRRGIIKKRKIPADSFYNSTVVARFVNLFLRKGKKTTAERVVYGSMDIVKQTTKEVPIEVPAGRSFSLGVRWLIKYATERSGKSMQEKLAAEIIDAVNNRGGAVKKREDTHKMAESNRAFAHYKW